MVSDLHPFLRKVLVGMARNVRETADRKDGGALATKTYGHLRQLRVGTGKVTEKMIPSREIADNLSKAGWSWGYVSAVDSEGRTIWIADGNRGNGKGFIVHTDGKADGISGTGIDSSRLPPTVLDEQLRFLPNSPSLNGFELGGGLFPAGFFAPIRTRDPRNQRSGEKEKKKDESTDFKNVEQNWSLLSAQEVTNR